ncbi:immunity protein Tsi6 family protein [Thalassotalea sp. PS06]|uniref:immunity protein Tsi6 family protein n=1 Tax=Thalassotalea sp. PS06 TaxID=2594005 RepID=UPI00116244C1|nr:immunity protein Tsi6 family protein [Thalassotalea sp. PS06]QDP01413.1 hypothetical protein FNC98_08780 [Thalassotalea sp. PS06]
MDQNQIKLDVCMKALQATEAKLKSRNALCGMYESVKNQLVFLIDYFDGNHTDLNRFKELSLGTIAVREVEDSDPEYAHLLKCAYYVAYQTMNRKRLSAEFINENT